MTRSSRRQFLTALAAAPLAAQAQYCWGQVEPELSRSADMITPEARTAIDSGLTYLADRQIKEGRGRGAFGFDGYRANTAVVALSGMAFMSHGSSPGRGPYGQNIDYCIEYVLSNSQEGGFIAIPGAATHGPMYGHGFATLFLGEVYGMSSDSSVREKLVEAVKLIVDTQNIDGGWRYEPVRQDADISVTVCQMMALRAARNAGIYVPNETVDRCVDYVKRSQNPDGGFMYMLQSGGPSAFPRSAAGVVAMNSAGIYSGEEVERGMQYLVENLQNPREIRSNSHFFYGQYYASQAFWHAGGALWRQYYPVVREYLLSRQTAGGYWPDFICPEYGTAMACIVLQMPNNYLPIFQR